ncbi:MAG: patatin-like phospholipase family protein [Bauldia sp.]|nr:patatin-like phospholipase family protein [Bauldia sp.]
MAAGPDDLRVGLALGGGAAQGFAHILVLEVLDELGLRPSAIAATSMGAVIGAAYAAGMSGAEIRRHAIDVFRSRSKFLGRLWQMRPRQLDEIAIGIGQYDLERALGIFLPEGLPDQISDLPIRFKAVATDYYSGDEAVLGDGPLIRAVAASAAVPMLFRPVLVGGRVMVDGNLCNPVPFDVLDDVDFVIASDVVTEPTGGADRIPGSLESLFGATSILIRSLMMQKLKAGPAPDVLIRMPTAAFNILDFTKAAAIMDACEPMKDEVRRRLETALAERTSLS